MADVDELVARPIALDLECGHVIAECHFEVLLRPERQLAHARMQPVATDDQIDIARSGMIEADSHRVTSVLDRHDRVAEHRLDRALQRPIDGRRQIGPPQAGKTSSRHAREHVSREAAVRTAKAVHGAHLADL